MNFILAVFYCALVSALKIPLAFLAYFTSLFFKKGRIPPSLFQRITATLVKTAQSSLPPWILRKLFGLFGILWQIFDGWYWGVQRKRWVKKLDATNEKDGWEGYLIADGVENAEIGEDVDMIILYAHGGGFVYGNALLSLSTFVDWIKTWKLSHGAKTQIVSVEYRLSPEYPFPAARDNMLSCYQWLVDEKNISPSKIAFGGDSAGGNLAVVSALYLVNQPYVYSIDPPAALLLISPLLSGETNTKSFIENAQYDCLDIPWLQGCIDDYIGDSNLLPSCSLISPVFESQLSELPKVWACAGSYEVLLDDITSFIEKLMRIHVPADLVVEDANFHNYAMMKSLSRNGAYENSIRNMAEFLYGEKRN